jgi:hypothetical protein
MQLLQEWLDLRVQLLQRHHETAACCRVIVIMHIRAVCSALLDGLRVLLLSLLLLLLLLLQEGSTTVAERVLRVSWPILPIGLLLSTAVCAFVLWRSTAQGGDLQYQQAVVAHGEAYNFDQACYITSQIDVTCHKNKP